MTSRSDEYISTSRELLAKAQEALGQDDLLQASEKLWGAVAHMVKGIGEQKGWRHNGHQELFRVVDRLTQETGDRELRTLFDVANSLHSNFYENWMSREWVEDRAELVNELIQRLERIR